MSGRVTFTLGERERSLEIPMRLAPEIEDATGVAIAEMGRAGPLIRYGHAAIVVAVTLTFHGIPTSPADVHKAADEHGMAHVVISAAKIINAFFAAPEDVRGVETSQKKLNGARKRQMSQPRDSQ